MAGVFLTTLCIVACDPDEDALSGSDEHHADEARSPDTSTKNARDSAAESFDFETSNQIDPKNSTSSSYSISMAPCSGQTSPFRLSVERATSGEFHLRIREVRSTGESWVLENVHASNANTGASLDLGLIAGAEFSANDSPELRSPPGTEDGLRITIDGVVCPTRELTSNEHCIPVSDSSLFVDDGDLHTSIEHSDWTESRIRALNPDFELPEHLNGSVVFRGHQDMGQADPIEMDTPGKD